MGVDEMEGVTAIPLLEVTLHFLRNKRQDVKIIVPEVMTPDLYRLLKSRGKDVMPEVAIKGNWTHTGRISPSNTHSPVAPDPTPESVLPNRVYPSENFNHASLACENVGPFTVSFANESAEQDSHYHKLHTEMYYSEHPFRADCKSLNGRERETIQLDGGVLIVAPNVIHKVSLTGMTMVVEFPALKKDREDDPYPNS
jgi:hypothetical protein